MRKNAAPEKTVRRGTPYAYSHMLIAEQKTWVGGLPHIKNASIIKAHLRNSQQHNYARSEKS
jgi:hypothetical protein